MCRVKANVRAWLSFIFFQSNIPQHLESLLGLYGNQLSATLEDLRLDDSFRTEIAREATQPLAWSIRKTRIHSSLIDYNQNAGASR